MECNFNVFINKCFSVFLRLIILRFFYLNFLWGNVSYYVVIFGGGIEDEGGGFKSYLTFFGYWMYFRVWVSFL